jgi:hypothetical protein
MEEKNEDSFFKTKENYDKYQINKYKNYKDNQSTEIMPSEDIFMNQKEEIKKIKRKRLELAYRESYKETANLKCYKIHKQKNMTTYKTVNAIYTKKTESNILKSNSANNRQLKGKKKITINSNSTVTKKVKMKLIENFNKEEINENISEKFFISKKIINGDIDNDKDDDNYIDIDGEYDNDKDNNTTINNENNSTINFVLENEIDFISLLNIDNFQKCECIKTENDDDTDENYLPVINEKWTNFSDNLNTKLIPKILKDFEFSKIVLKTNNVVDYNYKGIEITLHLKLFDKSSFYIFTRCYVDNDNNIFYNNNNEIFCEYSTVIKIFKNRNSKKSFASFGTFYKSKKSGNLHYKTFLQRQLVDFLKEDKNYYYLENDLCEFDIIIVDLGNENIEAKISLNNKYKFNNIKSNFYLPINKKAKLMFCGEGKSAKVTDLKIRSFIKKEEDKDKFGSILSSEQNSCDCCLIF